MALLVEHAADGRLTFTELEDRIDEAQRARFLHDLGTTLRELPILRAQDRPSTATGSARRRLLVPLAGAVLGAGVFLGVVVPGPATHYIDTGEASARTEVPSGSIPDPLPLPGFQQPVDRLGARAEVAQAYVEAFSPNQDPVAKESAVVRTAEMAAAGRTVVENFPEAVATTTVHVGDIVFTSPTTASLHFELRYTGGALFGVRTGTAVWDGRWKVTSATFCEVLSWGGGRC